MHQCLEVAVNVFSLTMFIVDIGTDVALAISYAADNDIWYCILTCIFIGLPAVVTNVLSSIAYSSSGEIGGCTRPLAHCCLLGMVYRYVLLLYEGITDPKSDGIKEKSVYVGQLTLLEAFLEAAPQLVLQLYIMISNGQVIKSEYSSGEYIGISKRNITVLVDQDDDFFRKISNFTMMLQIVSIILSLLSMSWSLSKNSKNLRIANDMEEMKWIHVGVYFLWHLCTIGARVLAVALFATAFTYWICVLIPVHCVIVGLNICCASKKDLTCGTFLKNLLRGLFYSFTFFGVIKEPRRRHCFIYFLFELAENSVLVGLWSIVVDSAATNFYHFALVVHFGCVGGGFVFMLIYFLFCHPNKKADSAL